MSLPFRILLVVGAVLVLLVMLRKIRKSEVKISDSLFWLFFVFSLVLLAIFPDIALFFAELFKIESPANLVFLYVIALLLIREFISTAEISRLRSKVTALAQEEALKSVDDPQD